MADSATDRAALAGRLSAQSAAAASLGSPLYAALLSGAAADVVRGGPCWRALAAHAREPEEAAVPLRFMAAVHRIVLRRLAPALAVHYPSVGGEAGTEGAVAAFLATVEAHVDLIAALTDLPCQTNEVGRSAALGAGLAVLAGRHRLPLHHLEIGTSAGLNLRWDHFAYGTDDGRVTWGSPGSPVDLRGHWVVPPDPLPPEVTVASRRGCDPRPLDPSSQADRETLTAAVWADMPARHARLKGALTLAQEVPADVRAAAAGEWLAEVLPDRGDGLTVVTHSVVWRYIDPAEQAGIVALLDVAGAGATPGAPLAWLRLEPRPPVTIYDGAPYPILATTWPGGQTEELGTAQAHGQEVRWGATGRIRRP